MTRELTHCVHGHPFTPENTKVNTKGYRVCRACLRLGARKRYDASYRGGTGHIVRRTSIAAQKAQDEQESRF